MSDDWDTCARCDMPAREEIYCLRHWREYLSEWACHGPLGCGDIHDGSDVVCPRSSVRRDAGAGSQF